MRYLFVALFFFIPTILFSQIHEYDVEEVEVAEGTEELVDVPFAVVEKTPIFPGCKGENNKELKKCTSDKIAAFVNKKFRIKKVSKGLPQGTYRIFVSFKLDTTGSVTRIRTRAPNPTLEKEAVRVINKLPKLQPGQHRGKNVGVLYSIPITFKIADETSNKKKKG